MTVTLGLWAIPLLVTLALMAWAILMPMPRPAGAFDIGGLLSASLRVFVVIVGSLIAWLVWALVR